LKKKKIVISVSRRTDIPAYYANWFRKRLEIGYTFYPNPLNSNNKVYQELSPDSVKAFVFWTRNPRPLFKHLDYIDELYKKKHYMHFTINGLPDILEIRNPKVEYAIDSAKYLADRYKSNEYVQWRYDPIVISSITPSEFHLDKFEYISDKIKDYVNRCYFSFVDYYKKTERNFSILTAKEGILFTNPSIEEQITLIEKIKTISDRKNIKLYACAEDDVYRRIEGIEKAHCVDGDIINKICTDDNPNNYKEIPSRIGCGCIESRDIGYYDSCPHGCIYCYANMNPDIAINNAKKYLSEGFPLDNEKLESLHDDQFDLFM